MDHEILQHQYLAQCLDLARAAAKRGEVPVGALVVNDATGEIVSKSFNLRETLPSPLGHAEMIAIHRACKALSTWRLVGHTLYVSLEPCVMCAGAIVQSRLDRVIFSATDAKGGGQTLFGLLDSDRLNHRVQWQQGAFADESRHLLQSFFKERRKKKS